MVCLLVKAEDELLRRAVRRALRVSEAAMMFIVVAMREKIREWSSYFPVSISKPKNREYGVIANVFEDPCPMHVS